MNRSSWYGRSSGFL